MPRDRAIHDDRPTEGHLTSERDQFIHTFFRKGAAFTEELIEENERLRRRAADLDTENAELRTQLASSDAIRDLLRRIDLLERDRQELLSRTRRAEEVSARASDRHAEIEAELSNLASLYVASYQLHASLSPRAVVGCLRELLAQIVGAREWVLYLADDDEGRLVPIAWDGPDRAEPRPVRAGEGPVGEAYGRGVARLRDEETTRGSLADPVAAVPMKVDGKVVGVIAILSTLTQKDRLSPLDYEVFKLLGSHAASALVAARLFAEARSRIPAPEAFRDVGT